MLKSFIYSIRYQVRLLFGNVFFCEHLQGLRILLLLSFDKSITQAAFFYCELTASFNFYIQNLAIL